MFQVVVGGTFPLVLGKLLHMAVKAEVQSCQLFLHLPHVFELLKGAYFTWKSDRLNQTWIWWRSVSCLVITSKSKVFPWQQRRKKIAQRVFDFSLIHVTQPLFTRLYFQPVTEYSPGGGASYQVTLPKACSLPEWKSLRRLSRPPSISLTSETSVRKECCRGDDWITLLGPAGWGALGFSLWGLTGKTTR